MNRNPLLNALIATLYIVVVASILYYGPVIAGHMDGVIVPIAFLSLFVLSAAVMGFLFLYQPFQLFLAGDKNEAINLFLKTIAIFAFITAFLVVISLSLNALL